MQGLPRTEDREVRTNSDEESERNWNLDQGGLQRVSRRFDEKNRSNNYLKGFCIKVSCVEGSNLLILPYAPAILEVESEKSYEMMFDLNGMVLALTIPFKDVVWVIGI